MESLAESPLVQARTGIRERLGRVYDEGFYAVARHVSRNGGSIDDAKDVYHDTLIIFSDHLENGKEIENEVAYITGIARHLWLERRGVGSSETAWRDDQYVQEEDDLKINELLLLKYLQHAGRKCMDLLSAFYFGNEGVQKLTQVFGFSSTHSASVQKYKCIEKIREMVKKNNTAYEDFLE